MLDVEFELNQLIKEAMDLKVSDIHVEPTRHDVSVKFRVDGLLQEVRHYAKEWQDKIGNRIKIVSNIDIGERRIPQDGRWKYTFKGYDSTLRVSSMPTVWGEKFVLRLQGQGEQFVSLKHLGMPYRVEKDVRAILRRPYGLFLVTGPTGSGKSTTLYALLKELHKGREQLVCLEDPVEYELEGATQVEINEKSGLTFAYGLRASLRQDPDIIMVGEIRDEETARLAIQAALTGHKVLSTIHTNRAIGVIERLRDIGIEPYLIKAALVGAIAQRLVRKPCPKCQGAALGCPSCRYTGYKGRIALYELCMVPRIGADWDAPEHFITTTLEESAKTMIALGQTTIEEVQRIGLLVHEEKDDSRN